MPTNCTLFIERLNALTEVEVDDHLVNRLYELCSLIENDPDVSSVVPHIFAFFEAHSEADFGTPGPLVHFLEKQLDYEKSLIESVARKPIGHTVWMVNRILNSKLSSERRTLLVDLLQSVLANPQSDEEAQDRANDFLNYQANRQ